MNKKQWAVRYIYYGIIALAIGATAFFATPIQVLKNWKIEVPNKTYHIGEQVPITSTVDKVRNSQATTSRSVQCFQNNSWKDYPVYTQLSNTKFTGHRVGHYSVVLPETMNNLGDDPVKCRIAVIADFSIAQLGKSVVKHTVYVNHSNEFKVIK